MKSRAFTLVEIMVYLALLLLVIFALGRITIQVCQYAQVTNRITSRLLREQLFFDLMRRDLMCAKVGLGEWDDEHMVFKKSLINKKGLIFEESVGFVMKKRGLVRVHGLYDFEKQEWVTSTYGLLCAEIKRVSWRREIKKNAVKGVCVTYENTHKCGAHLCVEKSFFVRLRNGEV